MTTLEEFENEGLLGPMPRVNPRLEKQPGRPADGIEGVRMSDVPRRTLRWLWPGRLAEGKLTILAGDPGLGKSFLTLDLAARVSRGWAWPDQPEVLECDRPARRVVLLSGEDSLEDTIRPRLEALGADLDQILAICSVCRHGESGTPFGLQTDLLRLDAVLERLGPVGMLVIDPVTAFLGNPVDDNRNSQVRGILAPLVQILERHGTAGILVTHLNKGGTGKALYRAMGSLAFVAAARTAFLVARDPSDVDRRLFLGVKNNLASEPAGLAFRVVDGGVRWEELPTSETADDVLQMETDRLDGDSKVARCGQWLVSFLGQQPTPARRVFEEAQIQGFHEKTVRRARARLPVVIERVSSPQGDCYVWSLDRSGPAAPPLPL